MILGFRIVEERAMELCQELKSGFDELFDSYLIEESMQVLIGKRNGLIWDCKAKEKKKERRIL